MKAEEFSEMRFEWADLADIDQYMADPEFAFEQKCDGMRLVVCFDEDQQPSFSLKSTAATQWYAALTETFNGLGLEEGVVLDGELMTATGEYVLFDVPMYPTRGITPECTFAERRRFLVNLLDQWKSVKQFDNVRVVRSETTYEGKKELFETIYRTAGEGVVAKWIHSPYVTTGIRSSHWIKFKFYKTADCVVTARNVGGTNARLALYENGELRPVGGCSMIGKPDAQVGDVIEVKFLGATADLILYQPTMLRIRYDKRPEACTIDQLVPMNKRILDA